MASRKPREALKGSSIVVEKFVGETSYVKSANLRSGEAMGLKCCELVVMELCRADGGRMKKAGNP